MAEFLHTHQNARLTAADWAAAITPPWADEFPNHGFLYYRSIRCMAPSTWPPFAANCAIGSATHKLITDFILRFRSVRDEGCGA